MLVSPHLDHLWGRWVTEYTDPLGQHLSKYAGENPLISEIMGKHFSTMNENHQSGMRKAIWRMTFMFCNKLQFHIKMMLNYFQRSTRFG